MTDAERHQKRLAILSQVNQILKQCHCSNTHLKQTCEHCTKLIPLGEQLLRLSKTRKVIKSDGSLSEGEVKERPFRCTPKDFTLEQYVQAKVNGCTDTQFATSVSMSLSSLYKWKRKNMNEIKNMMMFK